MRDKQLARLMDITLVTNMNTRSEIDELIAAAKKYRCACVFIMPCYLEYTAKALSKFTDVHIGGVMGFPYGMDFTDIKVAQTKRNIQLGADELDMVMNLGWLLSGDFERVRDDIKASELLTSWGDFKTDQVDVSELGRRNAAAVMAMDRARWK